MQSTILPLRRTVCLFCRLERRSLRPLPIIPAIRSFRTSFPRPQSAAIPLPRSQTRRPPNRVSHTPKVSPSPGPPPSKSSEFRTENIPPDIDPTLSSLIDTAQTFIKSADSIPAAADVVNLLERLQQYASRLLNTRDGLQVDNEEGSTSSGKNHLTGSSESTISTVRTAKVMSPRENTANIVSRTMYQLLCAPNVFITRPILDVYVKTQCLLGSPQFIPQIFELFASKETPIQNTSPVKYKASSPKSPNNAIPQSLATTALDAAIIRRDLDLAIAIVETTYATSAYRANRFLRKASVPIAAGMTLPFALYKLADYVAYQVQVAWDPGMYKFVVLAACGAYFGTLGVVGFVALTTYNDNHIRVSWQPGMEMRSRWLREDERAAYDRIALAWGFKEQSRWGEEQGHEWEGFREYLGVREMDLDRSNLLDGME